jgi:uncharacterized protein (TIRG00374 family)
LLAWVLHRVDARAVLAHVRHADPLWLGATVVLATLTFPIRTTRWRLILRDADGRPFPWVPLWHATAVGFMANNLLPARVGELARAYVATRQLPVRFTTALASVAVERVFDGLVLLGLMAAAIAAPSFPGPAELDGISLSRLAAGTAAGFAAALAIAFAVAHRPPPWLRALHAAAHRVLPVRAAERVTRAGEGLVEGLTVLKNPARFSGVVAWSLVLWLVNALAFAACFRAFALPVPAAGALLLQGVIAFGVAVPSSPSGLGVFEAATVLTLAAYGVDADRAVAYGLTYHVTTFVPIVLFGLSSQARVHVRLRDLRAPDTAAGG